MRFEDLEVWKRACRLFVEIFKAHKEYRDSGFKDQITRSSLSIPSNIAEGYERSTNKDATKFSITLKARQASRATHPDLYRYGNWLYSQTNRVKLDTGAQEISKMLSGLIKVRTR
jgi:four helix bundle protein